MNTHRKMSRNVLLAVVFAGLNLLCLLCAHHGRHAEQHARVNLAHVPLHGFGRPASRAGRGMSSMACVVTDHRDHAVSHTLTRQAFGDAHPASHAAPVATAARAASLSHSDGIAVVASINAPALGDAPRGTARPRAPPAA